MLIGKQIKGTSSDSIYQMALNAINTLEIRNLGIICDIGAGEASLIKLLDNMYDKAILVDDYDPNLQNEKIEFRNADLNKCWPIEDSSIDFTFSLEVIEHLENPRHFFRELYRILKKDGLAFISTPNNLEIFSRIYFLFKGVHRFFQDSCYPAHITPLLKIELKRLAIENKFSILNFFYNYNNVIPLIGQVINIKGSLFSQNIGILLKK